MIGKKLADRYEISAELGRGGMGVVYRGLDPILNREVAVKLIPPTQLSEDAEQRFRREAQLVAQMDHPAILPIYDFGRHEGSLFFVMPIARGTNLRSFLRTGSISLVDVLDMGIQIAEALEYSHARDVVHRDIKPENIMIVREEGGVRVRVMDFGLARATTETRMTKTGMLVGTMAYLSPEQVASTDVDGRSDVYSLGTILYECVAGATPFSGETQALLYRTVHEIPQPPRSIGAVIDEALEQIILSCLAKDPGDRPQSAGELAEKLKRYRSSLRDSERLKSVACLTRSIHAQRPALAPFVGRTREFAELQQRLNAALSGECQFAVIAGEPGIGKTRLLDELETLAKARKIRVLHGRFFEQDRSFPYQGFCELIQEFFRLKETASSPPPDLSDLAADLVGAFPMLSEISEIRSSASGASGLAQADGASGPEKRTQIFELLARTLTRIAGGRPLVLFLEDLHAAEISIEALQYIVRRLGPTPTLIVGTYRSSEVDPRHPLTRMLEGFRGDRRFVALTLGPLSPSEHRKLLETLIGSEGLAASLVKRVHEGTEGNPFFTKELIRSLLDSGGIARDDSGSWSLSSELGSSADALPATIQQAVEKRTQRLPDDLREILSVASVIGRTLDFRDLEKLVEGKGEAEDAVERLIAEGYLEETRESRGDILAFASGVVRDVLYAELSRRKRRSLHRRYAELLETRHAGRLERVLPQLVHHYYQGDVAEKTVEYGLRLARASIDAFSAEEAARSAKSALEFLDSEWEGDRALEGEARTLLATSHRMAGDIDSALREADAAVAIFESENQPARAVAAILLAAETAWQIRRSDEAARRAEKGLELAHSAKTTESLPPLLALAATLANLRGEYEKANAYLEEAARIGDSSKGSERKEEIPRGGQLVVALANSVPQIAPARMETNESAEISATLFEPLLATDSQGNLTAALCEKWEGLDDFRTFRLTLRHDVRFSDGTPLTARDVMASFESCIRFASPEVPAACTAIQGAAEFRAGKADHVAGIVVSADHQLEIRLTEPLPIYPALLTEVSTGVARSIREEGAETSRFVGTGPFLLESQEQDRIVLKRNPDYWKRDLPRLDGIEFRTSLSAKEIAAGFSSGKLDVARDLLPQDLEDLLRDPRHRQGLIETPKKNSYIILFNTLTGPIARNPEVRRALCWSVRTRDLVWQALGRFAQPASSLIPPGTLGHDPGRRVPSLTRDEALEILKSTGLETPIRLKASVHPILTDRYGALLGALFAAWSELGLEVSIETPDMTAFLDSWPHNEGLDLLIARWNADYDDPDNFAHTLFHSRAGELRHYFSSAELDRIIEEARSESRPAAREALYRKFESVLADTWTLLPLFHDIDYRLASPKVHGLSLRGTAPYVNYAEIGRGEGAEPEAEHRWVGGGNIQVPIAGVVSVIDPALMETFEQMEVVPSVFETLTRDAGDASIVPWLAAEFRSEDGGRRYRFRLREGVRFHDGRRLGARDVRYSFERLLKTENSECRWFYVQIRGARALAEGKAGDLAGIRIHSASEFSIELEEPVAFFPALLAYCGAAIIPEGSNPSDRKSRRSPVGTGPFRVVDFEPDRRLELERNRNYWRQGYPKSERLVYTFGVKPEEMLAGFREGRYSIASDLFPADVEALLREPEFASSYRESPRLSTYYLAFNRHRAPTDDRELRRRIAQIVDRRTSLRQMLGRLAVPATGFIPPGLVGHDPTPRHKTTPSSSGAPAPSSEPIELTAAIHPIYFGGYSAFYRELTSALADSGVKLRNVTETMAEWTQAISNGTVDVALGRWGADYPDSDTFVHVLHSSEGFMGRICGSPEIDQIIQKGRSETTPALRHSLYRRAEELLATDAALLPLFHEQAYRFARPEVKGLTVSFGMRVVDYENLHT